MTEDFIGMLIASGIASLIVGAFCGFLLGFFIQID